MTETDRNVDVYRVGMLYALHFDLRVIRLGHTRQAGILDRTRRELGRLARLARQGQWRDIRNSLGGWHAEHAYAGTRCGTGWTANRALRNLRRHLDQIGAQQ
jgi:hypothetical protein